MERCRCLVNDEEMDLSLPNTLLEMLASTLMREPTAANRIAGFLEGKGASKDMRYVLEITEARMVPVAND
jgi:hypothetical protein